MITFAELVCAVGTMRVAQKQYFRTKEKQDLYHAWNMERAVDQMLEQCFASAPAQPPGSANEITPSSAELNDKAGQAQEPKAGNGDRKKPPF